MIHRQAKSDIAPERMHILVGDVKDKVTSYVNNTQNWFIYILSLQVAILVDDMIDTGKTLALAAKALKDGGAKAIYCLVSHGLLSEMNFALLESLPIEALVVTNTIPQSNRCDGLSKLLVIDVSPTIAESIRRTHNGESISLLFGDWAGGYGPY